MLTKTFSLLFYLKKGRNYTEGKLSIYLRVTVDGQRFELATKRHCDPEKWNASTGRQNGTREEARSLNAYLETLQAKVFEVRRQMIESNAEITAEAVKNKLTGVSDKPILILEVFQLHNDQVEKLVGIDYALGTLKRYETSLAHTREFIRWKYKIEDLDIKKLDYDFVCEYEFWLKAIRKCAHNTSMKYLANFKKIVLTCVKKGWLTRDPFYAYKMSKREVDRQALTQPELDRVSVKDFGIGRLAHVRDIFVFCCYTGLAYADVYKLKRSELIKGIDGGDWITIKRQKTDSPSRVPLLPQALNILKRYENHPEVVVLDRLLPVLSNQKMNSYLKEIADVCGINKVITFHLARHTFATTVTLSNGVPIESVSKMLGHRNLKTTQQYAKIIDTKISNDMKALKSKLLEIEDSKVHLDSVPGGRNIM